VLVSILIFFGSLFLVIQGATLATKYSAELAKNFNLSKYIVGFIIVSVISLLPETLIAFSSALEGVPELGMATLFGSNIIDLSLIFGILILYSKKGLKIESTVLKHIWSYPLFIASPVLLGVDGNYSRLDGIVLIVIGVIFYYLIFKNDLDISYSGTRTKKAIFKNSLLLLVSMAMLLIGSHYSVDSALKIAEGLSINVLLIGLLVVSFGTTMPELVFSLKSIKKQEPDLAVGDVLGTVLADATIIVGLLAVVSPFNFPISIIYTTGVVMLLVSIALVRFMYSGKILSKKEGFALIIVWVLYAALEIIINSKSV
jgi:cation:H+ antiporter